MIIDRIDHIVLTVASVAATIDFYERVLGMTAITFAGGRRALSFGNQKINLHPWPSPYPELAKSPTPGAGDFCLITQTPIDDVVLHLQACGVAVEVGPVAKSGATGPLLSVYFRDPDGNLVEVSNLVEQ
ncbi:MAG: VOC family protein [Rhodospirillales bacterium]|nr:VOC family protein [Rhodospirillales bacterium]